jgi:tetratricopeptide (TPR) repeat protein
VRALLDIAETLWDDLLEFDEAALEFDRARVVAPREPEVSSQQARLEMRQGLFPEARTHLDEAAALARTAEERYAVASAEEVYFYLLGQYAGLRTAYARAIEAAGQHLVPVMAIQDVPTSELILNAAEWDGEQVDYALAQLDSMRASVEAPWNMLADIPATRIYLDVSDVASARTALESFRTINELFGDQSPWRRAETLFFEGRIAELEDGDCARSVHNYIQARDLYARSARTRWWLARCLTSLERWDEAGAEVDWLLERYPGHAKYHLLAARLHAARGATDESIAQLEVALDFWSEADEDYRPAAEARELLVDLRGRAESEPAGTDPPAAHRMPGARASRRAPDRSRRPLRTSASRRLP